MTTLKNPVVHIANRASAQVDKPLCPAGIFIMQNQEEVWLPVYGYEDRYEVSNFGVIRSFDSIRKTAIKKGQILSQYLYKNGYYMVKVYKGKKAKHESVHRLVALTFLQHDDSRKIVDHIDRNKQNNNLSNLRFVTKRENSVPHIDKIKTSKYRGVCWHKKKKKWQSTIFINGKVKYLGSFKSEEEAHKAYINELNKVI